MTEKIISVLISVLIPGIIITWLRVKFSWTGSKLSYYLSNYADFTVAPQPPSITKTPVYTHSINIKNNGNKAAEDVDVCHFVIPPDYKITPFLEHETVDKRIIRFKNISPGEIVTISYLYFDPKTPNQINEYVRSRDGYAKLVNMTLNPVYPGWFNRLVLILMILGFILIGLVVWWLMPVIIHFAKFLINYPR